MYMYVALTTDVQYFRRILHSKILHSHVCIEFYSGISSWNIMKKYSTHSKACDFS